MTLVDQVQGTRKGVTMLWCRYGFLFVPILDVQFCHRTDLFFQLEAWQSHRRDVLPVTVGSCVYEYVCVSDES